MNELKSIPEYENYQPFFDISDKPEKNEKLIILGCSATRKDKVWPAAKYALLKEQLPDFRFVIPLSTNQADERLKNELMSTQQFSSEEFLHVPLEELPYEVAKATYYISNDTGIKHLSIAMGLKGLTLFGPENPKEWHPYDSNIHSYIQSNGPIENIEVDDVVRMFNLLQTKN